MAANMRMDKVPVREQDPKVRATNFEEVCLGYNQEEATEEATRCLGCKNAKCIEGCPVSINIPGFIKEVKEGNISLDERNINKYSRKELATNISFVPQNVNMDVNFSVYDIIAMGRTPYLKRFQDLTIEDKAIIQHAMEITNCAYLKDKIFANLSGGESQRVLVARAIVQDTKYLI